MNVIFGVNYVRMGEHTNENTEHEFSGHVWLNGKILFKT
jgi:hypothetical protein